MAFMTISRRALMKGILAMPAIIRTPGLLMPVRQMMDDDLVHPVYAISIGQWSGLLNCSDLPIAVYAGGIESLTLQPGKSVVTDYWMQTPWPTT